LVAIGVASVVIDRIVTEQGAEAIRAPVAQVLSELKPLGDAVSRQYRAWMDALRASNEAAETETALAVAGISPSVLGTAQNAFGDGSPATTDAASVTAPVAALAAAGASPAGNVEQLLAVAASCDPEVGSADVAVLGDRVALRIFENSVLADVPRTEGEVGEARGIVFERLDLSGSYEIGGSGAVSLPAIGHVDVIGRTLPCIETLVAQAARERLRLQGSVSASFASRPPVLVRGMVRAPGAHASSPGMTVERILAQAGAIETVLPASPAQVAALKARRFELVAALASLRLEQARIDATLEGDASFGSAVDGWETAAALLSPERLASERAVMLADLAAAQARDAQFAARVDELVERTAVSQENVTASKNHLAYLTERRDAFRQLFDRGVVTEAKVDDATMQMMATQRILFQQEDTLMGLEADLRMAAHDQAVTRAEREQRLRIAARDVEEEAGLIFEQEQSVKASMT
jgi:protein involved in polysaccharide export with SLBB domain